MPYTKIMIHFIWATKGRQRIISKELKPLLLNHIKDYSVQKGVFIDCVNCVEDHIHVLVSLGLAQTVSNIMQLIKGESSFWVNRQNIIASKFEWQDEYIALSVSESAIEKVRQYISNQEQHHLKKSFDQEFMNAHGFKINDFG